MLIERRQFVGQLLRVADTESAVRALSALSSVRNLARIHNQKWVTFDWTSTTVPHALVRPQQSTDETIYHYPFIARPGRDRLVLASVDQDIVKAFLTGNGFNPHIRHPRIDVNKVVRDLAFPDQLEHTIPAGSYRLGRVWANAEGFGRSLRSVAFFGDDLSNASLFLDVLGRVSPFRVALRTLDSDVELISFSSNAEVSFMFRELASTLLIDAVLSFLRDGNYLHWD